MRDNQDMRRISAWVAIIAVPTMVFGLYGMNFKHMPELKWTYGYPMVVGSSSSSAPCSTGSSSTPVGSEHCQGLDRGRRLARAAVGRRSSRTPGVLPGNEGARRLYERRGFRPTWLYLSRFAGR